MKNEYREQRSIIAPKIVEDMKNRPFTYEQMKKQTEMLNGIGKWSKKPKYVADYLRNYEYLIENYNWKINTKGIEEIIKDETIIELLKNERNRFIKFNILNENVKPILIQSFKNGDKILFEKTINKIVKSWDDIEKREKTKIYKLFYTLFDYDIINDVSSLELKVKLFLDEFDSISSKSKLMHALFPEKNMIYDPKIIYSLNWIYFKNYNGDRPQYFPMPKCKSIKLNSLNIETIIRLKYFKYFRGIRDENKLDNIIFYPKNNDEKTKKRLESKLAYEELNYVITEANKFLWDSKPERKEKPIYTQMLLFILAEKVIYDDIVKYIKSADRMFIFS